ncbi:MAG TPA: SDR family oxidoreductase [Acidimicrobiales bacterium]|jgi:nucleoside-diphosphate-sugar epimerase|nr:SDR family oxidoreductase [Acidimicrobiales bacterium]
MRIFVTGASGWIGSAVVAELLAAGHDVVGLARSQASADSLATTGADVQRGTLDDLDVLAKAAADSDGVIHLAFKHDIAFTGDYEGAAHADRRAVETFGDALAGSDRPFLIASGTLGLAAGRVATEDDGRTPESTGVPSGPEMRLATAQATLALAARGVRSSVVRLPPTCHGDGDHGFVAALVNIARRKGVSGYIGAGTNRWPATHRLDVAHLFCVALEKAPAGSALHGVAEDGVALGDIAEVIGRHLGIPVVSIPPDEAADHFGFLASIVAADSPASSAITRDLLGWQPTHAGLIADLEEGHYFTAP